MRVELPSGGDTLAGELVAPAHGRPAPGIVILHDVWGLSDQYRNVARRIADAGFTALALDLYARGEKPGTPADMPAVMRFMNGLPDRRVLADVRPRRLAARAPGWRAKGRADRLLHGREVRVPRGASPRARGGRAVVRGARAPASTKQPEQLDALARPHPPILALFGAEDALIPQTDGHELRRRSGERGSDVEVVVYPGAGHAFANESRPEVYREAAASDGWNRAFEFFAKHLALT